jgi:hypothetical protein
MIFDMFLALNKGRHPPENILKFNLPMQGVNRNQIAFTVPKLMRLYQMKITRLFSDSNLKMKS